ncbi:MAG: NADH-quinone oxidoreductase subunit N [Bacteroidota bacterium]
MESLSDKIASNIISLSRFIPELVLVGGVLVLILLDLFKRKKLLLPFALTIILFCIWQLLRQWGLELQLLFGGFLKLDQAAVAWRVLLCLATFVSLLISIRSTDLRLKGEFYTLTFGILIGGHLLIMSSHLLILYLALEIMSISAYALTLFAFNKAGSEAAIKYLIFGAVSSAIMLYGISWIYTLTGSLFFMELEFTDSLLNAPFLSFVIGICLVLVGILFKAGAVPFHVWSPDVYTASPTPIVALFSTVPKLAAIAFLLKWLLIIHLFGLGPVDWIMLLSAISMASILFGNFSALRQRNVKRMMAYSSIAHTGFLIIPIVSLSEQATKGFFFYSIVYVLMNLATFMIIHFFERKENIVGIKDYAGTMKTHPLLSVLLVVLMISLTGIPPTAGFTAKLLIFTSLWESYSSTANPWLLALFTFGLINTVVALFFYLKVPFYMTFKPGSSKAGAKRSNTYCFENYFAGLMVLALLILFFKPDWLLDVINKINFAF